MDRRNIINQEPQHQRSQSQPENRTQYRGNTHRNTRGRVRLYQTRPVVPPLRTIVPPHLSPTLTPLQPRSGNLSPIDTTFNLGSQNNQLNPPPRSPPTRPLYPVTNLSPTSSVADYSVHTRSSTPRTPSPTNSDRSTSPAANQQRYQQDYLTEQNYSDEERITYQPLIGNSRNNQDLITFDQDHEQLVINIDSEDDIQNNQYESDNITIEDEQENENNNRLQDFANELNNLPDFNNFINNLEENEENEEEIMTTFFVKPLKFAGTYNEDPQEWLQEFLIAAKANGWNDDRKKATFEAYLRRGLRE